MARKPYTELPDVFARPGQAPERNTAIEDLPKPAETGPEPAGEAGAAVAAPPPPVDPVPAEPPATPTPAMQTPAGQTPAEPERPAPEPAAPPPLRPPVRPPTGKGETRTVALLAVAAVLAALAAPVVEDRLLERLGMPTPASRAQLEAVLTLSRQQQKLRDLEQRLAAATEQLAATRADLRQASARGNDGAQWGRLLSLGRVADALRGTTPFAADLAVAQSVGAGLDEFRPDFAGLAAYAGTGVPGFGDLDRELHRIADGLPRAGGFILPAALVRGLTGWTRWSRAPAEIDPTPELVQQAAAGLAEGDLEAAMARIRQIRGPGEIGFAGWLEDAQARLTADALVRRIDRALASLARELPPR